MFRIKTMSLVGLEQDREEGLMLRWLPEGFLIEMAKQKVVSNYESHDDDTCDQTIMVRGVPEVKIEVRRGWVWEGVPPPIR